jgi:hypothetical protein
MASLTFAQAKTLLAPFVSSQGATDPVVGNAVNFVNERFISSGQWRGNRFVHTFTVSKDTDNTYYFDTVAGIESVLKVLALDNINNYGEVVDVMSDWYPFIESGLGYVPPNYVGDTQIIRLGPTPANALPSGNTSETQRYRVIGRVPEDRPMYCLVRRGYVPLVNNSDLLIPSNRNAYRYGVQAYNYENINELERASVYWDYAYKCLNDETESLEEGDFSQVQIQTKAFAPSAILNLI